MPFSISLAGKGGVGKTTISAMLIKYLLSKNMTPVLAVDADSNANLNEVLGVKIADTLGNAREEMKKGKVPEGMTKDIFMSMKLEEAITEADGFDFVAMGQPEGSGCYCAANTLLTHFLDKLTDNYPYVVMDNEAGMEHISRLTTKNVDVLLIISDTSKRSLNTAFNINRLAKKLNIGVNKSYLIVNQVKDDLPSFVNDIIKDNDIELLGFIPENNKIYDYDFNGKATLTLPLDDISVSASFKLFDKIFSK